MEALIILFKRSYIAFFIDRFVPRKFREVS